MSIDQMYSEIIMMHNKSNHNKHEIASPMFVERGHNPNCGDDLTLQVNIKDDAIEEAAFIGMGCAISQASISIMIDLVIGKSVEEAKEIIGTYLSMIQGEVLEESQLDLLQDAQIFQSLSKMPARVKCGTLGWHCLKVIVDQVK